MYPRPEWLGAPAGELLTRAEEEARRLGRSKVGSEAHPAGAAPGRGRARRGHPKEARCEPEAGASPAGRDDRRARERTGRQAGAPTGSSVSALIQPLVNGGSVKVGGHHQRVCATTPDRERRRSGSRGSVAFVSARGVDPAGVATSASCSIGRSTGFGRLGGAPRRPQPQRDHRLVVGRPGRRPHHRRRRRSREARQSAQ